MGFLGEDCWQKGRASTRLERANDILLRNNFPLFDTIMTKDSGVQTRMEDGEGAGAGPAGEAVSLSWRHFRGALRPSPRRKFRINTAPPLG
jgi:hypothetical protein